ncbi:hypothetical protein GE253_11475 [Niveispirillum sp. SYP-B3756]|nr:hypothetical protein [Niveispirillum sp. SYP-B3756]
MNAAATISLHSTSGKRRGSYGVTLQGELGTILEWIGRTGKPGYRPDPMAAPRLSTSVKTWPWVGRVADVRGKHLTAWRAAITYLPFFSA